VTQRGETTGEAYRRAVAERKERERERVRAMAEERTRAKQDVLNSERRLVMAAIGGELSWQEVAEIAGVSRAALQGWARRRRVDHGE
jgi:hypothetical protein